MKKLNQIISVLMLSSLLLACSSELPQAESAKKEAVVSYSKPGAPISMQYKVLTRSPKAGDIIEIEVTFDSMLKSPIRVEMSSADKLNWLNDVKNWQSTLNKSGVREMTRILKVVAENDGIYYIHLIASVEDNNSIMAKPFTVALTVGNAQRALKQTGEVTTDENGQRIIIQQADTDSKQN